MIIVVGSSGEVGQLMRPHWRHLSSPVVLQYRNGISGDYGLKSLRWNPDNGASELIDWVSAQSHVPRVMLVLAGVTPRSGRDLSLNTRIAETCLTAARSVGIGRVLVASSSAVYGAHLSKPYSETDHPNPVNAYGASKLAMETACARFSEVMEIVCLRIGNVAGADALLRQALNSKPRDVLIDKFPCGGSPVRSYIGPGTMAETLIKLAAVEETLPPVLNFAAPAPVQMSALADAAGLVWREQPRNDTEGQFITLDTTRLWRLLPVPTKASDPAEMVAQLKMNGNKNAPL